MPKTIFFSWQADTPNKFGRTFLKEVLEQVCTEISKGPALEEALREIAVDSDTQGVAGQPPIADTILKKIDAAGVFVADMTFTGKRLDDRPTPNPNVLIEYGWALKSLGNERVIYLMNAAYGEPTRDSLPFDLAHLRWPISYNLAPDATPETKAAEKKKLIKTLKDAVDLSLGTIPVPAPAALPKFPAAPAKDGPARFRGPRESLGALDDFLGRGDAKEIFLAPGAAMWLRLMPIIDLQKKWPTQELRKVVTNGSSLLMPMITPAGGYSFLRAADGIGMIRGGAEVAEKKLMTDTVAFLFRTGEIWSIETSLLGYANDRLFVTDTERAFADSLKKYSDLLKKLGIDGPYQWKAGLAGVNKRKLAYPPPAGKSWMFSDGGPICLTDIIEAEGQINPGESATTALLPFFKMIFEECGIERPEYLLQA